MPESHNAPALDEETTAALTLFNEYVEADRERTQREKRIRKAERVKDEAAAAVKKLTESGSAEAKAEAESAYRDAAARWKKLRDGEDPDEQSEPPTEETAPVDEDTAPMEDAEPIEDAEPEPAPETPTADAEEASAEDTESDGPETL